MERIIIDADPGTDDAFAILLAAHSNELKIEGITTVAGNCDLENATNNTFKILDLANRNDISVYKGMHKSLAIDDIDATDVHGNNGMGGVTFKPINRQVEDMNAIDYLINTVNENPNEITIVAIGPLTNIAVAINKDTSFSKNIKKLIIMGGAIEEGNITPYAEFNFYKDPHAAQIVFNSNIKEIVMLGLDVTTKLPLTEKLENTLKDINNDVSNFLFDITRTCAKYDREIEGLDGAILNDPLTIAYLIDPSIVELKNAKINIETTGEKIGKSNIELSNDSNYKVAYTVDSDKFYNILFNKIFNINL